MSKKLKRLMGCVFAGTIVLGALNGCAKEEAVQIEPMEIEEVDTYSLDIIGGSDVMPIIGYYTPTTSWYSAEGSAPRDILTDEYYEMIADSGVNLILSNPRGYNDAPTLMGKALDYAAKYNIGIILTDNTLNGEEVRGTENPLTAEKALESMSNYMNHPGFAGVMLYDEPATSYFLSTSFAESHRLEKYTEIARVLNDEIGVFTYQNLNPLFDMENKENYDKYLTEYCETQYPNYIMFDLYPSEKQHANKEYAYLYHLATFREFGQKYDIPFWSFIACGSQWNVGNYVPEYESYFPDEGQFDWSANLSLAFGAKGLAYFPMFQPYYYAYGTGQGDYDFQVNGMFGSWGNKNQWYYYAQNMNKHVQVIDEILMHSMNKGILATGEIAQDYCKETRDALLEGNAWRELADVSGDAVIGCFNYQGKTVLYVVNASYEYAQKINLSFVDTCNVKVVQDAEANYIKGDSITLDMPAGDGVLLLFE